MNNIANKIDEIIYEKGVWTTQCRCWWMCINVAKQLPKDMQAQLFLAEGDNHYWLQDKDGKNYDVYGDFMGYTYKYESLKLYSLTEVLKNKDVSYDEKWAFNTNDDEKVEVLKKVYYYKLDNLKNYK